MHHSWDCEEEAWWGGDLCMGRRVGWEQLAPLSVGGGFQGKNSSSQHLSSTYYIPGTGLNCATYTIFTSPLRQKSFLSPILQMKGTEA